MPDTISIHNSQTEIEKTPELIQQLHLSQLTFKNKTGDTLPYCQYTSGADLPGKFALLIFLHGIGSVGSDNFLQIRMPAPPLVRFCNENSLKAILLFPQCPKDCQWVNVPWNTEDHEMPPNPSEHMKLAMELLNSKITEFDVDSSRIYGGGISMGGFGIWDMVCRMPETFAAAAVICGGADVRQAPRLKTIGFRILHGDEDSAVKVSRARTMYDALRKLGNSNVIYEELKGTGHNAWDPFFKDDRGMKWLFSQRKSF